jgi:hypothetical protein
MVVERRAAAKRLAPVHAAARHVAHRRNVETRWRRRNIASKTRTGEGRVLSPRAGEGGPAAPS